MWSIGASENSRLLGRTGWLLFQFFQLFIQVPHEINERNTDSFAERAKLDDVHFAVAEFAAADE